MGYIGTIPGTLRHNNLLPYTTVELNHYMRNRNYTKAITFSIDLFNQLRGSEARLWFQAFKVLIGMVKYCTTSADGGIKFDDIRHKLLVIQRIGISKGNFRLGLQFLVSKRILKEMDRYRYTTNPDLVGLADCWPAEPEEKKEKLSVQAALLETSLLKSRMGKSDLLKMEEEHLAEEYARTLLNHNLEDGVQIIRQSRRKKQTI